MRSNPKQNFNVFLNGFFFTKSQHPQQHPCNPFFHNNVHSNARYIFPKSVMIGCSCGKSLLKFKFFFERAAITKN